MASSSSKNVLSWEPALADRTVQQAVDRMADAWYCTSDGKEGQLLEIINFCMEMLAGNVKFVGPIVLTMTHMLGDFFQPFNDDTPENVYVFLTRIRRVGDGDYRYQVSDHDTRLITHVKDYCHKIIAHAVPYNGPMLLSLFFVTKDFIQHCFNEPHHNIFCELKMAEIEEFRVKEKPEYKPGSTAPVQVRAREAASVPRHRDVSASVVANEHHLAYLHWDKQRAARVEFKRNVRRRYGIEIPHELSDDSMDEEEWLETFRP